LDANSQSGDSSSVTSPPDHQPATTSECLQFRHWITHDLLVETQRVWSKAYGREISATEAMEILTNVRRLAEVLLRAGCREAAA
jgi:hypothetical protein